LVVKTVVEVTAKKAIDEGSLGLIIVAKGSGPLGCKEEAVKKAAVNGTGETEMTKYSRSCIREFSTEFVCPL